MNAKEFTFEGKKLKVLFLTVVGSTLHQLNTKDSDTDVKGVFLWDKEVTSGLDVPQDTLEYKNTKKESWDDLLNQMNKEFGLDVESQEDFTLFEARKWMQMGLKNDSNALDMLFSKPFFSTEEFNKVLENKSVFLDTEMASKRFGGMAFNCLKLGKKENSGKLLAKSLQMLMTFDLMLNKKDFFPVLPQEMRDEVMKVKTGNFVLENVVKRFEELEEKTKMDFETSEKLQSNKQKVNEMLVELTLSFL